MLDDTRPQTPIITQHGLERMAQRNLNRKDFMYTMMNGHRYHRAGAVHIYLRRKDIPTEDLRNSAISRLEGMTVVMSPDESVVITVWRNRDGGSHHIKLKRRTGR